MVSLSDVLKSSHEFGSALQDNASGSFSLYDMSEQITAVQMLVNCCLYIHQENNNSDLSFQYVFQCKIEYYVFDRLSRAY